MNSMPQLEIHPDAESLNAFVEQVLPEREREGILGHLAVCSRCRQVVYLAQEAAVGAEAASAAVTPALRSTGRRTSWFGSGWFVWVPAAALAGIAAVGIFVHFRHAAAGPELAGVTQQTGEGIAAQRAREPAEASSAPAPASAANAKPSAATARPAPMEVLSGVVSPAVVPAAPAPVENAANANAGASAGQTIAVPPSASAGQQLEAQEASVQDKPEPASPALQRKQVGGTISNSMTAIKTEQAKMSAVAHRALLAASAALSASANNGATPAPLASSDANSSPTASGLVAFEAGGKVTLPNGRKPVSFATAQHRTLALDQTGALFLSLDSGSHWEAVTRQWTGRAVTVRVGQNNLNVATPESAATPLSASGPAFEVVNDSHQVWGSADGRTWTSE